LYQKAVVHISDGKDSQTVKDFVETLAWLGFAYFLKTHSEHL
jgi:hypothetical protein